MASLGSLVAGVAHEINTPIGIALTGASHLQEGVQRLSADRQQGCLTKSDLVEFEETVDEAADMIVRNIQRASRLVNSFKQVAADQSIQDRRVFNLSEYLSEIVVSMQPEIRKAGHEITVTCPDGKVCRPRQDLPRRRRDGSGRVAISADLPDLARISVRPRDRFAGKVDLRAISVRRTDRTRAKVDELPGRGRRRGNSRVGRLFRGVVRRRLHRWPESLALAARFAAPREVHVVGHMP